MTKEVNVVIETSNETWINAKSQGYLAWYDNFELGKEYPLNFSPQQRAVVLFDNQAWVQTGVGTNPNMTPEENVGAWQLLVPNAGGGGSSGVSSVSITAGDGIAVASTGTASNPAFTITATGGGSGGTSVLYGTDIVKSLVSGDNMSLAINKATGALTLNSTATGGQTVLFGDKTVKSIVQGANTMLSIDDTGALTISATSGGTTSSSESVLTCNIPFSTGLTVNYTDSTNAALNMYNIIYYPIDTSTNASCLYSPSELDAGTYDFYLDIDLGNTVNATETTVVANVAVTANISLATIKNGKPDTVIANVAKQALNASTVSYTSNRVLLAKSVVIAADQNDCVLNLTNFTIAAADNFSLGVTGNISLVAIASTATVKKGK